LFFFSTAGEEAKRRKKSNNSTADRIQHSNNLWHHPFSSISNISTRGAVFHRLLTLIDAATFQRVAQFFMDDWR